MESWYQITIKYEKLDDSGLIKIFQDEVLLTAVNFTDAETKVTAIKSEEINREFVVTKIRRTPVEEIVKTDYEDYWFKAKIITTEPDEKTGKDKKYSKYIYISANDFMEAARLLASHIDKTYMADCEIASISITKITNVIE